MLAVIRLVLLLCAVLLIRMVLMNSRMLLPKRWPSGFELAPGADNVEPRPGTAEGADATPPALRLNGELEPALHRALPSGPGGLLILTFGDKGYRLALLNFVAHAEAAGAPHVVGAIDQQTFADFAARGSAVYLTPLATEAYKFDGSNQHASEAWLKFARMRTGEVARIVNLGYAVMHSDTDVVWLRDPSPYLRCDPAVDEELARRGAGCSWLRQADVAVSSDNMSPGEDLRIGASYAAGGTLNTGLLFIRPTPAGRAFATRWHQTVTSPPKDPRYAPPGCCTSDQQVFGRMVRSRSYPGLSVPPGSPARTRLLAAEGNLTLGALPLALFMNGHGYFVQRAHERPLPLPREAAAESAPLQPYAVHATYTLDNHDGHAKAQRFREAGLWRAGAPPPAEERFLALNFSTSPAVAKRLEGYARRGVAPSNIDVHLAALGDYVSELRDALALARALGRTLVLPRWTCWCDRMWAGSDDIFHFGCMYPGAQDGRFVPFTCPMDHVLSPAAWAGERGGEGGGSTPAPPVAYRDAVFVEELAARGVAVADVLLLPRETHGALLARRAKLLDALPLGTSASEARSLLAHLQRAPVIRLPHARGLLCAVDEPGPFNDLASHLLHVPTWCSKCFAPCEQELAKWLLPDQIRAASTGPNSVCFTLAKPPEFEAGRCVLNI